MTSNPVWTRSASIEDYGAHPDKTNYMGQAMINAMTDVDASHINRVGADLAAVGRVAPFMIARMTLSDTVPAAPTVHWCAFQPVSSESLVDFLGSSPPTGFPSFTRTGSGVVRVTFDSEYEDPYGNSAETVLRAAGGSGAGAVFANVVGTVISSLIADFSVFNSAGAALTDQMITIRVF